MYFIPLPSAERISEALSYVPETGLLFRKARTFRGRKCKGAWNNRYAGKEAGYLSTNGYIIVVVDKKRYVAHRLIWVLVTGLPIPDGMEIDHVNGIRTDNRFDNLRLVDSSTNGKNSAKRSDNRSGVTGIYWYDRTQQWHASFYHKRKSIFVGYFNDLEVAKAALFAHRAEYGYTERHGSN